MKPPGLYTVICICALAVALWDCAATAAAAADSTNGSGLTRSSFRDQDAPGKAKAASGKETIAPAPPLEQIDHPSRWNLDIESDYTFQGIPNPFFYLGGNDYRNPFGYHLATEIIAARYRLTDDDGPPVLRGHWEGSVGLLYSAILRGPETFYAGGVFGLRYNLVPKGSRWSPFIEVRCGIGWTDSRGFHAAQQQDFTIMYLLSGGLRYKVNERHSISVGVLDQHISNAYMTNPNYGFDSLGFTVSDSIHF